MNSSPKLKELILRLMNRENLQRSEARDLLTSMLSEDANNTQIAAALVALGMKGETVDELTGLAEVMRDNSAKIKTDHVKFVDTAGTGSSRVKTFNVSTAAAFVIAGTGLPVAKHGSRAATSRSGSADVLEKLGVNVGVSREVSEKCLNEIGICFMFAPLYHESTARVGAVRRELNIHTTFNLLGPMTNPANAPHQVMGVWHEKWLQPVAETLRALGTKRALVVHGTDGLDEITISARTKIAEVTPDFIKYFDVAPEDFGLETCTEIEHLRHGDAEQNAKIILEVLESKRGDAAKGLVLMNAAAALFVGGNVKDFKSGAIIANESLQSGMALKKLNQLREMTNAA